MLGGPTSPFRMSLHHSQLGDPVFEVISAPLPPQELEGEVIPSPLPARTPHDDLVDRLDTIISELEGLRADLAARTLAARCRRLWAWIRSRFG